MPRSFSLSMELIELIDSTDKSTNISRVVESLLIDYFRQGGKISDVIEKNKKQMAIKEKIKLDQFKKVIIDNGGELSIIADKHWKKELMLDDKTYNDIKLELVKEHGFYGINK